MPSPRLPSRYWLNRLLCGRLRLRRGGFSGEITLRLILTTLRRHRNDCRTRQNFVQER
jgi:hypothetical protein